MQKVEKLIVTFFGFRLDVPLRQVVLKRPIVSGEISIIRCISVFIRCLQLDTDQCTVSLLLNWMSVTDRGTRLALDSLQDVASSISFFCISFLIWCISRFLNLGVFLCFQYLNECQVETERENWLCKDCISSVSCNFCIFSLRKLCRDCRHVSCISSPPQLLHFCIFWALPNLYCLMPGLN